MSTSDAVIREAILKTVAARGRGKTCCPSDIARDLGTSEGWRDLMPRVREVAAALAGEGRIRISQGGETVDPAGFSGPIRLGRARD